MKFFIVSCLAVAAIAAVSAKPHGATSYQNIHHFEAGGYGGHDGSGYGGHEGGHGGHYKYEYGVKDFKTGDNKEAWEQRDGDVVKGSYTLKEADGTTRVVEYKAGKHGVHAEVKRLGHASHPHAYGHGHGHGGAGGNGGGDFGGSGGFGGAGGF